MSATTSRRPKWQYPQPPPTPRILQLPRRGRRNPAKTAPSRKPITSERNRECKGRLDTLFDQERMFARTGVPVVLLDYGGEGEREKRREKVEEREGVMVEEEKWRFQAEMLRAECNLLRMEKEIAAKKLERYRANMERTLRSAIQGLIDGRKRICEGKDVSGVFEEEIRNLAEKLDKLQRSSGTKESEIRNCSNFDKKASLLQRRLNRIGGSSDEDCVREVQEMAEASLSINTSCQVVESFGCDHKSNMEVLRRKMEGFSKGMLLKRLEEDYGLMLFTANRSAPGSASTSTQFSDSSSFLTHQKNQQTVSHGESMCSRQCKAIVQRIIEQVHVEMEQWSQMQEMLRQVRDEMEELQASRDFWEDQAHNSDHQIQSLRSTLQEWEQKALFATTKSNELQAQLSSLKKEHEQLKERNSEIVTLTSSHPVAHDGIYEMEKHVLVCHLKERRHLCDFGHKQREEAIGDRRPKSHVCSSRRDALALKRSPFREIVNFSSMRRQSGWVVYPSNGKENF